MSIFATSAENHQHSLDTLNQLQEYDEFMESIQTVVDLGCGDGLDLEWWATRMTREDRPKPLNIQCTGIDLASDLRMAKQYPNITYQQNNFEEEVRAGKHKYDVLWCHNSFQYAVNPIQTLSKWWEVANDGAMLVLILPQTTHMRRNKMSFTQESGCYYHHTMVSLIHMLAISGWDCHTGFFKKDPQDTWLHAIVYKSDKGPQDPRTTTWHKLSELKLLPDTAEKSVYTHDLLRQEDLILPWLDQSLTWLGQQ